MIVKDKNVIREITPLSEKDCFSLQKSSANTTWYSSPVQIWSMYGNNMIAKARTFGKSPSSSHPNS